MTDYKIALSWLKAADRITIIGTDPQPRWPVHVTLIVSGPPKPGTKT